MKEKDPRPIKKSTDVSEETSAKLAELKKLHGVSLGDLIEWAVANYDEKRNKA